MAHVRVDLQRSMAMTQRITGRRRRQRQPRVIGEPVGDRAISPPRSCSASARSQWNEQIRARCKPSAWRVGDPAVIVEAARVGLAGAIGQDPRQSRGNDKPLTPARQRRHVIESSDGCRQAVTEVFTVAEVDAGMREGVECCRPDGRRAPRSGKTTSPLPRRSRAGNAASLPLRSRCRQGGRRGSAAAPVVSLACGAASGFVVQPPIARRY